MRVRSPGRRRARPPAAIASSAPVGSGSSLAMVSAARSSRSSTSWPSAAASWSARSSQPPSAPPTCANRARHSAWMESGSESVVPGRSVKPCALGQISSRDTQSVNSCVANSGRPCARPKSWARRAGASVKVASMRRVSSLSSSAAIDKVWAQSVRAPSWRASAGSAWMSSSRTLKMTSTGELRAAAWACSVRTKPMLSLAHCASSSQRMSGRCQVIARR